MKTIISFGQFTRNTFSSKKLAQLFQVAIRLLISSLRKNPKKPRTDRLTICGVYLINKQQLSLAYSEQKEEKKLLLHSVYSLTGP